MSLPTPHPTYRWLLSLVLLLGGLLLPSAPTFAQGPIPVSPRHDPTEAVSPQECPTFSWTAAPGTVAIQIEVYARLTETLPPHEALAEQPPLLTRTIAAPAVTWTPSLPCLTPGGRYLWYVQAQDALGQGPWSAPTPFTIQAGLSPSLHSAVEEAVERYLTEPAAGTAPLTVTGATTATAPAAVTPRSATSRPSGPTPLALEGASNTFYGTGAGNVAMGDNDDATFIGAGAGAANTTGAANTFVGRSAGGSNPTGFVNTFVGQAAGASTTTGSDNTFVGRSAGFSNTTGLGNVFLGYQAGLNATGSNRLYIDNSSTTTPLLYGEFDTNKLTINGNLTVIGPDNGLLRLSNITTDATTKVSRLVLTHYTTAQLPVYLFGAASTATNNFVAFGGGNAIGHAATQLDLYTAPTTTTPTGTPRLTIKGDGKIGLGTQTPTHPLELASGAHVTAGGVWTNASSRTLKEQIQPLEAAVAQQALHALAPVTFRYTAEPQETYVGFIAEDVPALVATADRQSLSSMDIVAVLTRVVQAQQQTMEEMKTQNAALQTEMLEMKTQHQHAIATLTQRLLALEQGSPHGATVAHAR